LSFENKIKENNPKIRPITKFITNALCILSLYCKSSTIYSDVLLVKKTNAKVIGILKKKLVAFDIL
jgi:hypothetical protein